MDLNYDEFIKKTMENQPVINIGMIGHVANGKSTIVKNISGEATQRHSDEKIKNITIKLGYANAKIYQCPKCPKPECYQSMPSTIYEHRCILCAEVCKLVSHVSFADCPGHHMLMSTMLNGACIMNYAILVESATNDKIPELQTMEHFEIAHEAQIPTSFVCLNKLDLMMKNKNKVPDIIERIQDFTESFNDNNNEQKKIPVIPVSGTHDINIDVVLEYIANMQIPKKNLTKDFKMLVIRSFNVNKEKTQIKELKGGVIGGSLVVGMIDLNNEIIIYPGYTKKNPENSLKTWSYTPLKTKALSINSGKNSLNYAIPGGLIGIQLDIDSYFTGDDRLTGNVIYNKNRKNVKVYEEITLKYKKLTRKLTEYITEYSKKFDIKDIIQINVNSNNILCKIKGISKESIQLTLDKPICLEIGDMVTISKYHENSHMDIFGRGIFESGVECDLI
jgi:translation initiation factor 2 subunit 3